LRVPGTIAPVEAEILRELADGPGHFEAAFVEAPGCDGPLRVLRGGRADAAGDVVVLLHGRGHAAPMWFPIMGALAERARVLAVDLPGFGLSGTPPALSWRARPEAGLGFFVEPVEAVLAREVETGGARRFVVVGHSLGGLVGAELALRARVPVARLALIDAMGMGPLMTRAGRVFFRLHPERLAAILGRRLFERLNPPAPTPLGRRVADLEHELFGARPQARRAAARAFDLLCPLVGVVFNRGELFARLNVSTVLLWGQLDPALPAENAAIARSRLPVVELVAFPALGHSPHLEAPEKVLPHLLGLL
jgi:pimeloyl-ACP methyl ester carboxylesterase